MEPNRITEILQLSAIKYLTHNCHFSFLTYECGYLLDFSSVPDFHFFQTLSASLTDRTDLNSDRIMLRTVSKPIGLSANVSCFKPRQILSVTCIWY